LDLGDASEALAVLDRDHGSLPDDLAAELRDQRAVTELLGRRAAETVAAATQLDDPNGVPPAVASALIGGLTVVGRAEEASQLAERTLRTFPAGEDHHLTALGIVWHRVLARWQLGRLDE